MQQSGAATLFVFVALANSSPGRAQACDLTQFDYPSAAPVVARLAEPENLDGILASELLIDSPRGGRITATLFRPESASGRLPAVIYQHWAWRLHGDRSEFVPEAVITARRKAVTVVIDSPYARPDKHRGPIDVNDRMRDADIIAQSVVDVRRTLDWLATRSDVDITRVAFVGHSYGAHIGSILVAAERRFHSFVIMAGEPSLIEFLKHTDNPEVVQARTTNPAGFARYLALMAPLDAIGCIGAERDASLLFQFGDSDRGVPRANAERFVAAAKPPRTARWYDAGHELNFEAAADRQQWLAEQIGLSRP